MSESTRIDAIRIENRHRRDFRDLDSLAASIQELGVLQPVLITPDLRLIAGERRIRAAKSLGMATIPTRVVSNLTEAADLLKAERDENVCRQEMTVSERVSLARQIEELEKPKARERMLAGVDQTLGSTEPRVQTKRSADVAGDAVGMSRVTYQRAKYVIDTANDDTTPPEIREVAQKAVEQMDQGEIGVLTAQKQVNDAAGLPPTTIDRGLPTRKPAIDRRPPAPPKYGGNRRKHLKQIEALIVTLSGASLALQEVRTEADLDPSVTSEEAARLVGDLSREMQSLNRIRNLLKERTK